MEGEGGLWSQPGLWVAPAECRASDLPTCEIPKHLSRKELVLHCHRTNSWGGQRHSAAGGAAATVDGKPWEWCFRSSPAGQREDEARLEGPEKAHKVHPGPTGCSPVPERLGSCQMEQ